MSEQVQITLPKLGESIVSATVLQWFKQEGDPVALDEPLLEVSTDKINSEIPSPVAGVLKKILAQPNQELAVGEPLAFIEVAAAGKAAAQTAPAPSQALPTSAANDFISPSVMRLLQEKGIPLSELDRIPRTGEGGRLTKRDVEQYAAKASSNLHRTGPCPMQKRGDECERVQMSPMRKAIAENMVRSFYQAPHASLITEVDVTELMKLIQREKEAFLKKNGAKLTITSFVARAVARAVQAFPLLNASLDGEAIVMKRYVNLGIAVSVEQGVMVPVIKGCQQLPLAQIAQQIAEMAEKARGQRLSSPDTQDGSITLTNFGMTGTSIGIPIIRYPEVAIIGLGAIAKKAAAMPDDSIAVRSVMMVSLTFDHRVLDGLYGCGFLAELKKHLESDLSIA